MFPLWLHLFLALCTPAALAADAELRGRVIDAVTGFGISGAEVTLDPGGGGTVLEASADLFGYYQFPAIPPAAYTLGATATGYGAFSEARSYGPDELATEDIPLTATFPGSSIDLQIQVTDTRTDVPLNDVPVRVQQFATPSSSSPIKTTTAISNTRGEIHLRREPSGYYEFRFNDAADGTKLAYYNTHTPDRTGNLATDHCIYAKLLPVDQSMTIAVTGPDPADPETVPAFLKGAMVEMTPVDPAFTIPGGFDPMTDDLRDFATSIQNPVSARTDMTGGVSFSKLGPYAFIITVNKPGYSPKQLLVPPAADGTLPATTTVPIDLVPGTGATIVLTHPAYPPPLLVGLPILLEGLQGGPGLGSSATGITRTEMTMPTGGGPAVSFPGLLPGRYRASIDAGAMTPPFPASEAALASIGVHFRGQIQFEVSEGIARSVVLATSVVPAKIRGRFFKADGRAASEVRNVGGLPSPLDRWLGPAYQLAEQGGIEFIQSDLAVILPPGPDIVSVDTDEFGNFEIAVLPGFYGVEIPSLDGYWGSNFRSVNRRTGETFELGWPYAIDPSATGGIPAHPFGSLGIPVSSGDDLEIDLYVRKQTYFLDGTVFGDTDCPLLDHVIARTSAESLLFNHGHFAGTGSVSYDEFNDGSAVSVPLEQDFSVGAGGEKTANINARFLIEAPPGSHKLTLVNPQYALPAGVFEIVGLPDYGYVGSGDSGTGGGIIPMENNWGQLAAAQGTVDPFTSDYKGDHHLSIEFVEDDGMGGFTTVHTTTVPNFVENADFPGILFATGGSFEMAAGDWTIYSIYDGEWFKDFVTIPPGTPPTIHTLTFDIDLEGGPGNEPPTPSYDFTVRSINAADPGTAVPNIKLGFDPPLGDPGPDFISTGATGTTTKAGYTGGYLPLSVATSGPDAEGITKWVPENGVLSPFTSYDLDISVPGGGGTPAVTLTSRHKRGSMVSGTVRARKTVGIDTYAAPFPDIPVELFDRHGNRLATLVTDSEGDFSTAAALPATPVLHVRIDVPGYVPYFARFTPNSGDDTGPDIDFDLSTPGIDVEMIPQPDLIEMDELFDRAGPFIPGIRREPGSADDIDPSLEMTWTATGRSATKWDQSSRNFDTAAGSEVAGSTTKVMDPVTKFWIINKHYFDGLKSSMAAAAVTLPAETDPGTHDPDPLFNAKMRTKLRELEILDPKGGHLIFRSGLTAPPVVSGTGDAEKTITTGGGTIALPDLPPGVFEVYLVAETERGAYKYELYPGTSLGAAEQFLTLYGLELPAWLSAIADLSETYAEVAKPGPPLPYEILPVQNFLRFDPGIAFSGEISDNPDGTLKYDYELGAGIDTGGDMPFSGLTDHASSILAYSAKAGLAINGKVGVALNGSRSSGTDLIGAPEINISGGAAFSPSIGLGGPGAEGLVPDAFKPGFLKFLGVSPSFTGEAAVQFSTSSAVRVPFREGDELGVLDRRFALTTAGVVEPGLNTSASALYTLLPAPPPIGLFMSGLADAGVLPNASLEVKGAVGLQMTRESTTRFQGEIPSLQSSLTDPSALNPIVHALGEEVLPLPGPRAAVTRTGKIYTGFETHLRANTALSLNTFHGFFGTTGTPIKLPGSNIEHQYFTVHLNRFGDRPNIIRITGAVGGELEADMRLFVVRFTKSLGAFEIAVDWTPNTEERFYYRPYTITDALITPGSSPSTAWLGTSPQLAKDIYPLSKFAVSTDGTGALAYVEPKGSDMALKLALRSSPTAMAAPVEIASAPGIVGVAVHPLPSGGWMAAWSELDAAGVMELAPASTVMTSTSADGLSWSTPLPVATLTGTAFDLRLVPMPGNDLGLLWLESDRGPGQTVLDIEAALWDGATTTWGAPQFLYDDIVVKGWDVSGPGFTGVEEAQIVAFTDLGGFVAAGWDGTTTSATVGLDTTIAEATECAITMGPVDTFTAVHELDGGGIAAFRKVGSGSWSALPAIPGFDGQGVSSLDVAATDDGAATHHVIALSTPPDDHTPRFVWLDEFGAVTTGPGDLVDAPHGHYRDVRLHPVAGSHAAEIVTLFEYEDEPEMRWFSISESAGVPAVDRDGDTLGDLDELRIVDADPDDAIETIDEVFSGDDFDGDGSDNGTELAAGTDPIDDANFPGQVVELDLTDLDAAEFGADSGLLHLVRSGETGAPLTVTYAVGGTATPDTDYPALGGTAEFAAGQSAIPLFVVPMPDGTAEGDETVSVTIDSGIGYTLGPVSGGTVTIEDQTFDAWRFEHFTPAELADLMLSGEDSDFEADTFVNLIEFAFDMDPKSGLLTDVPAVGTVTHPTTLEPHLALAYLRRKDDASLIYTVQISDALGSWTDATGSDIAEVSVVDNGDGTETVTVRDVQAFSASSKRFLRLKVTRVGG